MAPESLAGVFGDALVESAAAAAEAESPLLVQAKGRALARKIAATRMNMEF